jgi:hypothetical protein
MRVDVTTRYRGGTRGNDDVVDESELRRLVVEILSNVRATVPMSWKLTPFCVISKSVIRS